MKYKRIYISIITDGGILDYPSPARVLPEQLDLVKRRLPRSVELAETQGFRSLAPLSLGNAEQLSVVHVVAALETQDVPVAQIHRCEIGNDKLIIFFF